VFLTPSEKALIAEIRARLSPLPDHLGVAVSGGSDSLALLYLLAAMTQGSDTTLHVATVDHRLRAESHSEAQQVANHAAGLGLAHDILTWNAPRKGGNLQGEARAARYRLLGAWARSRGIAAVAVGHTADDQAETVLMRLRRASGVTGLSGMPLRHQRDGIDVLRPLLGLRREDLRSYLTARGVEWIEDPSNQDLRFERVRVRDALKALEPMGLTVDALTAVADNMRMADAALDQVVQGAAETLGTVRFGAVVLDRAGFHALTQEVARRLLVSAVTYVSGSDYPPRRAPLLDALAAMGAGRGVTLQGCQLVVKTDRIWICREYQMVRELRHTYNMPDAAAAAQGVDWDDSWQIIGPAQGGAGLEIRALGPEGLSQLTQWRSLDAPREALLPLPAVWRGGELVAAPLVERSAEWSTAAIRRPETWARPVLSH